MKKTEHTVDFCVVGGGIAGVCAAIAAARQGLKVAIMQDRPMWGGNASSEIRMHVCGADRHNHIKNLRETGILEEIRLENLKQNPQRSFSIWDMVLHRKIMDEPNITALLNCSCLEAATDKGTLVSVTGWQLTSETFHTVKAAYFADCSGDGILAPLSGAEYRYGREARSEFDESIAPEVADDKTMGMTCLFQAKDLGTPQPFERPAWSYEFKTDDDMPKRNHTHLHMGYWWVELGGEHDTVHDAEELREELLRIVYGVWDHIKNKGDHGAENWALDWIQFLPGKREARRYEADHQLNQNDIASGGQFDDIVAYGGWSMDDHDPAGFWAFKTERPATIFHKAPSPFGIPYRSLYSRNIKNLFCAGRNAGCTHAAMSSTRVMGTGAVMGQAVGNAAAIGVEKGLDCRGIGQKQIAELQDRLRYQDCWLPGTVQKMDALNNSATISAPGNNGDQLVTGINRPIGDNTNAWEGKKGDVITFSWDAQQRVRELTLIADSALDRNIALSYHDFAHIHDTVIPEGMLKDCTVEIACDGQWSVLTEIKGNYQRLIRIPVGQNVKGVRVKLNETWGSDVVRLYAMHVA